MNNMYDILAKMNLLEGKGSKPDFPDIDNDGNRTEPIGQAAKQQVKELAPLAAAALRGAASAVASSLTDESNYSAKAARAGRDIGKPGKNFEKIAKSAGERYGSKAAGERVAGAVLAKLRAKESVQEGDVEEGNDFTKARLDAIKAGKPTFRLNGKVYKVTGDTSDEQRMDEGYVDFMDKKAQYRGIGADVEGRHDDYTVTFKDGSRRRYQELDGRRRVTTLEPVDAPEEQDAEGNVVKRGRGRPKGTGRAIGTRGVTDVRAKKKKVAEATGNLDSIVRANQRDVDAFMRSGDLSDSLYNVLFDYYFDEMPYGTAKARTGDPYEWISDRFHADMGGGISENITALDESHFAVGDKVRCKKSGMTGEIIKMDRAHGDQDEKYYTFRRSDGKVIKKAPNELTAMANEDYDRDEYDEEGEMAMSQARTIEDAAEELQSILDADENLPEWVQKKITLAKEYIDSARDYLKANRPEEEVMAEKAVSKAQRAAAGIAYAAKKGDIPKSELRGASKEMAKMDTKELGKFAKTKEKDLPSKVKETDKKEVEETTVAGSVATAPAETKKSKGGMQFGKGVYEGQIAESFERKLSMLTEGMSINMSMDENGKKSLSVSATDEDAVKLAQILKLAGMESASHHHGACPSCGEMHEGECEMTEGDLANSGDNTETMDTDYVTNTISGGLNGPKLQVNPNNMGDNPMAMRNLGKGPSGQINLGAVAEDIEQRLENRLMDLYKRIQ